MGNDAGAGSFNLLDEPWIPVLYRDGRWERVGIRKALEDAGRIRQIAASNPMDRVAMLRFLIAIVYWCKGNPPSDSSGNSDTSFSAGSWVKLEEHRDCFNLLGEGKRFYQFRAARRPRAVTDLLQEIPTGNNFWHFRHSTDEINGLCLPCVAAGLLRLPLFSVSGLPDLKAGINGTPPIYVLPICSSLKETLRANWIPGVALGNPAWSDPDTRIMAGQHVPFLTGLTLLSRRAWLHAPDCSGRCVSCASQDTMLIRKCEYQSAGDQKNDGWNDPHVVYSDDVPRRGASAFDLTAAGKFRMDRPWPDLIGRIVEIGKFGSKEKSTSLLIVGFATDKAKNIDVWERTIEIPPTVSVRDKSSSTMQQWQKQCAGLIPRLIRCVESKKEKTGARKHKEILPALTAIRPHVENAVSARVTDLLSIENAWERAAKEYSPMLKMLSKSISPGFTVAAVHRQNQIESIIPNMTLKTDDAKKPARKKKGGDK